MLVTGHGDGQHSHWYGTQFTVWMSINVNVSTEDNQERSGRGLKAQL